MKIINKTIYLHWKNTQTPYALANKDVLYEPVRVLGTTRSASLKMISYSEEMKEFMNEVLGLSNTSPDWDKTLAAYWHSLSVDIPVGGKALEIGFVWDVTLASKKEHIDRFNSNVDDGSKIKTTDDAAAYFEKASKKITDDYSNLLLKANNISDEKEKDKYISTIYKQKYEAVENLEKLKYKFGTPINIADYLLYRYALIHSDVANEFALVGKSNNIRFYLHSEEDIKQAKEEIRMLSRKRMEALMEVIKDSDKVENLLYAVGLGSKITNADATDRDIAITEYSEKNPKAFIANASNPNLDTIGLIEKYIERNVLKRLEGSTIIVDSNNPAVIVGNDMKEAITFFKNEKDNKQILSEFKARYLGLPKK